MGYLIREQSHDSGGKFGGNVYVLQDEAPPLPGNPSNGEAEKTPLPENTVNGENRQRETPSAGFPPQQNKDLTEEETKNPINPQGGKRPQQVRSGGGRQAPPAGLCGGGPGAAPGLGGVYRIADPAPAINSARAVKMLLGELDRLSEGPPEDKLLLIRQSVANSWKSVFPLRRAGAGGAVHAAPEMGVGLMADYLLAQSSVLGSMLISPADRGRRDDQPPAGGLHRAHGAGGVPGHPGPGTWRGRRQTRCVCSTRWAGPDPDARKYCWP